VARARKPRETKYPRQRRKPNTLRVILSLPEKVARRLNGYCALFGFDRDNIATEAIREHLKHFEASDATVGRKGLRAVGVDGSDAEGERREVG
jgi:hypothetical protein